MAEYQYNQNGLMAATAQAAAACVVFSSFLGPLQVAPSPVIESARYVHGTHRAALEQSQIATAQSVFSPVGQGVPPALPPAVATKYIHGTHRLAIEQQQIANASRTFNSALLPQQVIIGIKRDFVITQEEQPLDAPSQFLLRGVYLVSSITQNPLIQPAIQTLPQYPLDQQWSFVYSPQPAPTSVIVQRPPIRPIITTLPQEYLDQVWSDLYSPAPAPGPIVLSLMPCVIEDLQEVVTPTGQWTGNIIVSWSLSLGASSYRLYVNGVPQQGVVNGRVIEVTGLLPGQFYTFAVVATAAGIDDSPLSNVISYAHGTNEFVTVTKYPWGNTFQRGYVIKIPLGTKV